MDPSGPSDKSSAGDLRETEGGELPKKRRRRCGWDAPAPAPAPAPADQPVAAAAPASTSPSDAVSVGVPSSAAYAPIDPVAAQRLAFQKAQEILASSGLNMVLGSVGNLSHAAAVAKSFDCRVYVGSLNYSVTDVEIRAIFGSIGHIRAVDMPFDAQTQRTKGFCFVDFENANDARAALSLNGVEIAGRPMKVGRPQGGPNGMSAAQMQAAATAAAAVSGYGQLAARAALSVPSTSIVTSSPTHADDSRKYTVVLDNMVPLHEASDPTLKAEIEEEAAVYGPLKYISIEVVRSEFVRVKLVYLGTASALNAYRAMDGRYFGGKLLKASLE